ncbi:hypothetical protein EDC94DRAFT_664951 [Helicostylum pulchrum]|nr:hypothetical protein EDC94DRAFT_664951 [Helicostylum pulchrum]
MQNAGCSPSVLRDYLDKNLPVTNNIAWSQYAKENFDNTAKIVVEKNAGASSDDKPKEQSPAENNLQETIDKTSNCIANFSEIVFLTMLLLKDGSLVCKDNETSYDCSVKGLDLSKILPKEFIFITQKLGPAPLSHFASNTECINEINGLFEEAHLGLMHSHFFGARGQMKSSIENNPVQNSLIEYLASIGVDRNTYTDETQLSSVDGYCS